MKTLSVIFWTLGVLGTSISFLYILNTEGTLKTYSQIILVIMFLVYGTISWKNIYDNQ